MNGSEYVAPCTRNMYKMYPLNFQAERRIEKEVARKLEVISADETQWPAAAKDSLARLSRKLEAMHDVMARLQSELDSEQHDLALEQAAKQSLQVRKLMHEISAD